MEKTVFGRCAVTLYLLVERGVPSAFQAMPEEADAYAKSISALVAWVEQQGGDRVEETGRLKKIAQDHAIRFFVKPDISAALAKREAYRTVHDALLSLFDALKQSEEFFAIKNRRPC